ncbi:MAG: hypothetical protein N2Z23_00100 [Pyrinomonadaceae bacterium]|nr:hypothetical protein [Pyrinomonadaceae bacterium]MCX7638835.1 hypothetical protein [Pyrinomonadaceae bacterium]MDW8305029.1 hypothetical protein [Acidobacteriota bacterium]
MYQQTQFRENSILPTDCITNSWEVVKENFGIFILATLIFYIMISCLSVFGLFLYGPLMAGVYYMFLKRMNDESFSLGDLFKGFENFLPTMTIGLLRSIPDLIYLLGYLYMVVYLEKPELTLLIILLLIYILLTLIFKILMFFSIQLIVDYQVSVVEAIKLSIKASLSNIGGVVTLIIFYFLLSILGLLAFCIGVFITLPIAWGAEAFAYRQVFPKQSNPIHTPPPPTVYGQEFGSPL